ncbi:O-antigen ligase family protein [Marinobacter sp. DY40_1A1]|uniref:O-antigen ligase family protein n=1 Tax=Marinobacter sp. DY40_1A1 TaxID=2583229 RepID=UPI001902CF6D|nr:O-antigen ligase family protein [Marinobacter sp. DY40_1A1]MBK1885416.1 O-antigen ligase family protein [Marinobacter sp. DY40_1A1]
MASIKSIIFEKGNALLSFFILSFVFVILVSSVLNRTLSSSVAYLSHILFFFTAVFFLSACSENYARLLRWKILSVFSVCIIFFVFRFLDKVEFYETVFRYPPIYRHLRHLNYDLMLAVGACFFLLCSGRIRELSFYSLVSLFVLISLWSGGRGQLLAFVVFLVLLSVTGGGRESLVTLIIAVLMTFLIWVSGDSRFMLGQLERTLYFTNINGVSSGRLNIWKDTWLEIMSGGWFGHGADQFRIFYDSWIVHPHNAALQFMFEYGVAGLLLFVSFILWTASVCLKSVFASRLKGDVAVTAALILAMYAYSMVDGIFYHAIPFSFMVLLSAGLFVKLSKKKALAQLP